MRSLTHEACRDALAFIIEGRVGADAAARILNHAQKGDALCLVAIADALDIEPDELFEEFCVEVYALTGELIRPIGHIERHLH